MTKLEKAVYDLLDAADYSATVELPPDKKGYFFSCSY